MSTLTEDAQNLTVSGGAKFQRKTKVFFDVINSVKGGSGKSTFSFLLAGYHAMRNNVQSYIVDLDIRGTSWEKNYADYITTQYFGGEYCDISLSNLSETDYEKYPFIDNLLWNLEEYKTKSFWSNIKVKTSTQTEQTENRIFLCPGKADYGSSIDQLEVDLFENTVCQMIVNELIKVSQELDEIHFIFDMPPSYEVHAERILKHLLTSLNSTLYRRDPFKGFENYIINLFMVSALSPAHIEQNNIYITHWFRDITLSSAVWDLIEKNRFFIRIVGNDVTNILGRVKKENVESTCNTVIEKTRKAILGDNLPDSSAVAVMPCFNILGHLSLDGSDYYFNDIVPVKPVISIPVDAVAFFNQIL